MGILKTLSISHKREANGNYCVLLQKTPAINQPCLIFEGGTVICLSPEEAEPIRRLGGYVRVLDGYACLGMLQYVHEGSKELLFLVIVTGCVSVGKIQSHEIFCISDVSLISMRNCPEDQQLVRGLKQLLSSGCFYFSHPTMTNHEPLDITLPAQKAYLKSKTDNRFFWNRLLHHHFNRFGIDASNWLVKVICGSFNISTVYIGGIQAKACLISRLSCERAGTRFIVRGVNDLGHVANFVETEQVIYYNSTVLSFITIRGSIPLFWEQPGVQVGSHRIKMSRGSEISQPGYDKHMFLLKERYDNVVIINLLSSREAELNLNQLFNIHHKASLVGSSFLFVNFDYHALCSRGNKDNLDKLYSYELDELCDQFSFFHSDKGEATQLQKGVFRVNCLDCLDRTNAMQTYIGVRMLAKMICTLERIDSEKVLSRLVDVYSSIWIQNGDQISRVYTGTGALEGKNRLKDGALSVARTIQNNLLDDGKQNSIDILIIGRILNRDYSFRSASLLPPYFMFASPNILVEMCDKYLDYCKTEPIKVAVATWNVNGGRHFDNSQYSRARPLSDWLLDYRENVEGVQETLINTSLNETARSERPVDIYAIGFQEIVDLNAQNIMASSTQNQRDWLVEIQRAISREHQYLIVTSVQLVGVCLLLFIRSDLAPYVKDVCSDQVKTGLKGATGNKGAVAVRFRYKSTSLCFVCAHFAAGQNQVKERNEDYTEITRRIQFPMGKSINSHDYVFWCGDFNYRLDRISNEDVRLAAAEGNYKLLLEHDQLKLTQKAGLTFKNYMEGEINFAPTYKYDTFTQDYDSSEKCRVPAYTDRILFKKCYSTQRDEELMDTSQIKFYNRIELLSSDHRPVIAEFEIEVLEIDQKARHQVLNSVLDECGPPDATVFVRIEGNGMAISDEQAIAEVLKILEMEAGEIVLIRYVSSSIMVIFSDGRSAIKAADLNGYRLTGQFQGFTMTVSLRTHDWRRAIRDELKSNMSNTTNLITGESPKVHLEDDEDETAQELNMSIGPQVNPEAICLSHDLFLTELDQQQQHLGDHIGRSPSPFTMQAPITANTIPKSPMHPPSRPPPPPAATRARPVPLSPMPPPQKSAIAISAAPLKPEIVSTPTRTPRPSSSAQAAFGFPDIPKRHANQEISSEMNKTPDDENVANISTAMDSINLLEFSTASFDGDETDEPALPPPTLAPPNLPQSSPLIKDILNEDIKPPLTPSYLTRPTRPAPPPPVPARTNNNHALADNEDDDDNDSEITAVI